MSDSWNKHSEAGERRPIEPIELSLTDTALEVHAACERGEDIEEFDFRLLDGPFDRTDRTEP